LLTLRDFISEAAYKKQAELKFTYSNYNSTYSRKRSTSCQKANQNKRQLKLNDNYSYEKIPLACFNRITIFCGGIRGI
jgi:hypothetical protein